MLLDQGDISQWKWGLVRRSCELLKQCATMNSIDLPDLQPWDPVWNRPKQIIQHDAPTAKQFAESENIYVLVWMVNKRMEQLGLSENTVRHYTEEGLAVILKKHYDSGTESYSDKLISQLTEERRLQYEQGEVGRTTYQNLRKAAAMLQEFRLTGKITLERIPNWGRREVIPQHKAILDKFSAHVTTQSNWAESSASTVTSVARVFLLELLVKWAPQEFTTANFPLSRRRCPCFEKSNRKCNCLQIHEGRRNSFRVSRISQFPAHLRYKSAPERSAN